MKSFRWLLLLTLAVTAIVYTHGLNGPFLFDDSIHITKNQWVKIDSLSWPNLVRAWNSSFSAFPSNRPLAQLSFGINHALAGLDPWAFKATNLAIHLATGLMVFVFAGLAYRALFGERADRAQERYFAVAAAALWLLSPLQVSTVLYTVQRMAQLSTLATLIALSCYLKGRLQIAAGRPGLLWMLASAPIALVGFLAKENTALLPLLLLVCELTLLQRVTTEPRRQAVRMVWLLYIGLPLLAAGWYLFTHPALYYYDERPFTLTERVLTQPRVLWLYLRMMLIPDISTFGLFHDDLPVSTGLFTPVTTILAIAALAALFVAAVLLRRRSPVFAFAVLFFLGAHALESSVLALEMVFEHRNYLASLGPFLLLSYGVTITAPRHQVARLAGIVGGLLLLSYATVTYLRVDNWSSYQRFVLNAAETHPRSARANFAAAQFLISAVVSAGSEAAPLADAARGFLHNGLAADARCINCLFGLVVLDLHQGRQPDPAVMQQLRERLRSGYVGPTKVSVSQFSYLVKWLKSGGGHMGRRELEGLFEAALANPGWNHTGRGSIESAYREYFEFVAKDLQAALRHAQGAVNAWPDQWSYQMQLVRVLRKLERIDEARAATERAAGLAGNEAQRQETADMLASLANDTQQ